MVEVYDDVDNLPKDLGAIEFLREHPQILKKLIEYSVEKSLKSFIKRSASGTGTGGFDWSNSREKGIFWREVLTNKKPEHFYTKYPKVKIPDYLEIKQKFPVGCTFNNDNLNKYGLDTNGKDIKVTENARFNRVDDTWVLMTAGQGDWTVFYNGYYADIITMESKIDPPYLVDIQKMFPIGTIFNNKNLGTLRNEKEELFIKDNNFEFSSHSWVYKSPLGLKYTVWNKNGYAIILGKLSDKKSLLEQAKERYPIGTIILRDNIEDLDKIEIEVDESSDFKESTTGSDSIFYKGNMIYDGTNKIWSNIKVNIFPVKELSFQKDKIKRFEQAKTMFTEGVIFAESGTSSQTLTVDKDPIIEMSPEGNIYTTVKNHYRGMKYRIYDVESDTWVLIIGYDRTHSDIVYGHTRRGSNPYLSQEDAHKIAMLEQMASKSALPSHLRPNINTIPVKDMIDVMSKSSFGIFPRTPEESYKKTEFTIEPMKEIPIKEVSLEHIKFTIEKLK